MKLLDRYILRNFFEPFLICFFGFLGIWLVFDLSDNGRDFIEAHATLKQVAGFYATQLPATIVMSLPVGLLLALLFALSRMSRRNEIISMLTAGRSVLRILVPLLLVGVLASVACMALDYSAAPHADAIKRVALEEISKGSKGDRDVMEGYLFRDRQNHRTWYIRRMKPKGLKLSEVHITQQDADGRILSKWYAESALYQPKDKSWLLTKGMRKDFDEAGNIDVAHSEDFLTTSRLITDWTETPWRIASAQFEAQHLSVPELSQYLQYNADFPSTQLAPYRTYLQHRFAVPWSCLVVVFIAAPLGIVNSRRGVLASVASSIFIFFAMLFLQYLFLALGKGDRVPPWIGAWGPDILFFAVGLILLYFRATNRDIPRFRFRKK